MENLEDGEEREEGEIEEIQYGEVKKKQIEDL